MSFPEFARCAGYSLPAPPRLSLASFYEEEGRTVCREALLHLDRLIPAFEAYLLVGGFPQAVSEFRRTASVSAAFARDLWDVIRADLGREGVSRPEQALSLLEQLSAGIAAPTSMRSVADRLGIDSRTAGSWINALANSYLLLVLFKESSGVPDVNSQRKIYPIDPLIGRLPALHSPGVREPDESQLAEAALALAIFRSVEGDAVDRFRQPGRLFYFRSRTNTEIDFLVLPERQALESKYIDTADRRELQAMLANFGDGLLLTRSGIDVRPLGSILPISVFSWLLAQEG
jgi:predicted AAA+ superfamily ATPase